MGVPRSSGEGGLGSSPPARSQGWGGALATAVARQLLSQATVLLPLLQELLAVLHREGPSTEGIFRKAASGTEFRELREALDRGARVDLGSQPALLLAVVLKDFLRSIPAKLLVNDLYEDWMAAMERTSKEEKVSELKA
ncbi:T-cell activation Rho GTPase-activating protein-like [Morphnus guianensis]